MLATILGQHGGRTEDQRHRDTVQRFVAERHPLHDLIDQRACLPPRGSHLALGAVGTLPRAAYPCRPGEWSAPWLRPPFRVCERVRHDGFDQIAVIHARDLGLFGHEA